MFFNSGCCGWKCSARIENRCKLISSSHVSAFVIVASITLELSETKGQNRGYFFPIIVQVPCSQASPLIQSKNATANSSAHLRLFKALKSVIIAWTGLLLFNGG